MRRWQSHKIVEPEPIDAIQRRPIPRLLLVDGTIVDIDSEAERVRFFGEHSKIAHGDYLVRYADGYLSWSPKAAFEEGYREVEPNALEFGAAARRVGLV